MNWKLKSALGVTALVLATQAAAQITFYEHDGFRGRAFTTDKPVGNFARYGFNDRASSVVVEHGRWEVCTDAGFAGRCVVLRRGSYESLGGLGMNDRISSVRPVIEQARYENEAPPPLPEPTYEYRRRPSERIFEVPVTSVHAVVGPPEQRCWIERQQVVEGGRGEPNVGGAIVGGIIGGVLGHQVGDGKGKQLATVGGAVGGGYAGNKVQEGMQDRNTHQETQRKCQTVRDSHKEQAGYDVTYRLDGREETVHMDYDPGRRIKVENGVLVVKN